MASDDRGSGLVFFLAGAALGALAGILFAPKSGRETREEIRRYADEHGRDALERAEKELEKARRGVEERAREFAGTAREKGEESAAMGEALNNSVYHK